MTRATDQSGTMDYLTSTLTSIPSLDYSAANGLTEQTMKFYVLLTTMILVPLVLLMKLQQSRLPKLPPGPPGWPILGHLPMLGNMPHQVMMELSHKYGEIYSLKLGSRPCVVVSTPKMARVFLETHDKNWASRSTDLMHSYYLSYDHKGIGFSPYGPNWRQLRKIVNEEIFTEKRMEASTEIRKQELHHMIRSITHHVQQGKLVTFKMEGMAFTANMMARLVLNRRFTAGINSTAEEVDKAKHFAYLVRELFELEGMLVIADYVPWLRFLDIGGAEKRMKALFPLFHEFLNQIIAEHEVKRQKGPIAEEDEDMVDVLLNAMNRKENQDKVGDEYLDMDNVKAAIMDLFVGGVDTPNVLIEWTMAELIRNPPLLRKLKEELDSVVGKDRFVEETDIPKLKYLRAVVGEAFRLHPAAPLLAPHASLKDSEVEGYHFPAGTILYINTYAISRSPESWERPLEFDPERFMSGPDVDVSGRDFRILPFGSGRRRCPAINMGVLLSRFVIASMVHAFDWSLPEGQIPEELDMTEVSGLTVPLAKALELQAKPRLAPYLYI
ncbi:hypothetical protein KC19_2G206800 [Ceratodon purpureus]|uniref:Uncharacterized protein n=1 Tax=Ceratodon purpureus TaxID=3225 RepID=A0A8T0IXN9_CERPU|nr:hypothetical protein KC19_2G206800 [Ceratodon purpureus]